MDLNKHKETHDNKVDNNIYVGPDKPIDVNTKWNHLNLARKRMGYSIPGNTLGASFIQALNTAEGTELFSVWENGDKDLYKVILKNIKDDWDKDVKSINAIKGVGFEVGNTVTWQSVGVRWLITSQDYGINEFFKGEIRKATHLLRWKDSNGFIQEQWAAVQGPVETRAKYEQTRGNAMVERRNDTTEIWIGANNKEAIKSFKKFSRVMINGSAWEVQVRDDISSENIYRMSLIEDYTNLEVDDLINAIPAGLIDFAPNEKPVEEGLKIVGASKIHEKLANIFFAVDPKGERIVGASWSATGDFTSATELPDGSFEIVGRKIGDKVTISCALGELVNSVEVLTVSMFSDLDKS